MHRHLLITLTAVAVVLAIMPALASRAQTPLFEEPQPRVTVDPVVSPLVYSSGTVVLRVSVTQTGRVSDVEVVRSVPALTGPVVEAVRQWEFSPARFDNRPIAARTTVVVHVALVQAVGPALVR